MGYKKPTRIQEEAIPLLLEGHDLLGIAQTGTGKTASFCLPVLNRALAFTAKVNCFHCRALILAPTRELATQIYDNLNNYSIKSSLEFSLIIGGVSKDIQVQKLSSGVDIIVATPGRLIDILDSTELSLTQVETFVLDEADMMLDMGFHDCVKLISSKIASQAQKIMFSATMPAAIEALAESLLSQPKKIEVSKESSTVDTIKQSIYYILAENKNYLLLNLLEDVDLRKVIIFCKAKYAVANIVEQLKKSGITVGEIHSNRSQAQRNRALEDFNQGVIRVLVATDIASRGLDINGVNLVINYDLPEDATYYVHRIGRTARAGRNGMAISLCTEKDLALLRNIQNLIKLEIPRVLDHPFHIDLSISKQKSKKSRNRKGPSQATRKKRKS